MSGSEPSAPDRAHPRYSRCAFPAYRFIPGLNPHPRRDPKGHSYGIEEPKPPYLPPERWRENETYLFGVDLYNFAYWWESHEQLEALWHLTDQHGHESHFLQGIIQAAAANLKQHTGAIDAARTLAAKAAAHFAAVGAAVFMGLELEPFSRTVRSYHIDESYPRVPLIRLLLLHP